MKVAYVTDLALQPSGGGSFGVNWNIYKQLEQRFSTTYCPLPIRVPLIENYASKIQRKILKRPGRFAYFSRSTLDRNAASVSRATPADIDAIVFRSATRWCHSRPSVPYFVYLDAVFHTFFHNTFDAKDFLPSDVERIWRAEADFLEGAKGVFFENHWGMTQAIAAYDLRATHYYAPGAGGVVEPPISDTWNGMTRGLLTIAMNFEQKGGDITLAAYRQLKSRFPSLTWDIVGGPPTGSWKGVSGIKYHGVLKPDVAADREILTQLLSQAFLMIHPTREDVSPLVLTEAAYFGCPSISVNMFGIPELVLHDDTGILIDPPVSATDVAIAIESLLVDLPRYTLMRSRARSIAVDRHSWEHIGAFISERILDGVSR